MSSTSRSVKWENSGIKWIKVGRAVWAAPRWSLVPTLSRTTGFSRFLYSSSSRGSLGTSWSVLPSPQIGKNDRLSTPVEHYRTFIFVDFPHFSLMNFSIEIIILLLSKLSPPLINVSQDIWTCYVLLHGSLFISKIDNSWKNSEKSP